MLELLAIFLVITILLLLIVAANDLATFLVGRSEEEEEEVTLPVPLRRSAGEREQAALENLEAFSRRGAWQATIAALKTRQLLDLDRSRR